MFAESVPCQLGVAKSNMKVVPVFHARGPATESDLSPNVLLQRCIWRRRIDPI